MKATSKWEEEREVITYINFHPPNTILHTLSFTLMAKLTRRRRKITTSITPKSN